MKKGILLLLIVMTLNMGFGGNLIVTIPKGATAGSIARILKTKNIIKQEWYFKLQARLMNRATSFIPGKFRINDDLSTRELILALQDPANMALIKITIPEGYNLFQIDELLAAAGLVRPHEFYTFTTDLKRFGHLVKPYPLLATERELQRLEGFLFPDTYLFEYDASVEKIVATMLKNFMTKVVPLYEKAQREKTLPKRLGRTLKFYNLISLAALVEDEAMVDHERPIIASVYINRMNKRMILGACPTVLYARLLNGLPWKETLSYKDTELESTYNTYKNTGLPPSPISNPGLKSILASFAPATTDYYFFVARGDGTHQFSRTEKEHIYWKRKLL